MRAAWSTMVGALVGVAVLSGAAAAQAPEWQEPLTKASQVYSKAAQEWSAYAQSGEDDPAKVEAIVKQLEEAKALAQEAGEKGAPEQSVQGMVSGCDQLIQAAKGKLGGGTPDTPPPTTGTGWQQTLQQASTVYTEAAQDWSAYVQAGEKDPERVEAIIAKLNEARALAEQAGDEGAPEQSVQGFTTGIDQMIVAIKQAEPWAFEGGESDPGTEEGGDEDEAEEGDAGDLTAVEGTETAGFTLKLSDAWAIEGNANEMDLSMADPELFVNIIVQDASGLTEINDGLLTLFYGEVKKQFTKDTLIGQQVEAHKGNPSGWLEFKGEMDGEAEEVHMRLYCTLANENMYIVTIGSAESVWEGAVPHWQAVMEQFDYVAPE